jgi:hypothetical protein
VISVGRLTAVADNVKTTDDLTNGEETKSLSGNDTDGQKGTVVTLS